MNVRRAVAEHGDFWRTHLRVGGFPMTDTEALGREWLNFLFMKSAENQKMIGGLTVRERVALDVLCHDHDEQSLALDTPEEELRCICGAFFFDPGEDGTEPCPRHQREAWAKWKARLNQQV